tara:strand:- start:591 stop:857 length:267 start_codon:yes stop_codon:yes gene_type:complete
MSVKVEPLEADDFLVKVDASTSTEHRVTLSDAYWNQIWNGRMTKVDIIERSFAFLLQRESNSSILRSFELPVIQRYFPEYEKTAARWE